MIEHRKTPRHRVLKGGTISVNRTGGIDCTIRNVSDIGACLDVVSPIGIPDDFELVMAGDHSHRACHVIWRHERRIGVAFS